MSVPYSVSFHFDLVWFQWIQLSSFRFVSVQFISVEFRLVWFGFDAMQIGNWALFYLKILYVVKLETIYSSMLSMLCDSSFLVWFWNDANGKQRLCFCFIRFRFDGVCFSLFFFSMIFPCRFCFVCSTRIGYTEASWINQDVVHKWRVCSICEWSNHVSIKSVKSGDHWNFFGFFFLKKYFLLFFSFIFFFSFFFF